MIKNCIEDCSFKWAVS